MNRTPRFALRGLGGASALLVLVFLAWAHAEPQATEIPAAAGPLRLLEEGYQRLSAGRTRDAEAYFRAVLTIDARNVRAREGLVRVHQSVGEPERAAREADGRLAVAPGDVAWRKQWIWIIFDVPARREEAISAARALAEERPNDLKARLLFAEVLSATDGRLMEAIAEYRKAVALAPSSVDARKDLAQTLSWTGRYAEALAEYRTALALDPMDREAKRGLAQTLSLTGHTDEAKSMFDALIAEDPRDAEALSGRAEIARWDGDFETASRLMQQALAVEPGNTKLKTEEHDVALKAAQLHKGRWGPTWPLVLGLMSFCVLVGYMSRGITVRVYAALVLYIAALVGLAFLWFILTP